MQRHATMRLGAAAALVLTMGLVACSQPDAAQRKAAIEVSQEDLKAVMAPAFPAEPIAATPRSAAPMFVEPAAPRAAPGDSAATAGDR